MAMRPLIFCLGLAVTAALGGVLAAETSLLSASAPGAYAVRFWPDRVVLSCSAGTPVTVRASLPQAAEWAVLQLAGAGPAKRFWSSPPANISCG